MKAAYIYSGSYEAAEDIAQDTFLKLYIGFDHFRKDNIPSIKTINKFTFCVDNIFSIQVFSFVFY